MILSLLSLPLYLSEIKQDPIFSAGGMLPLTVLRPGLQWLPGNTSLKGRTCYKDFIVFLFMRLI